MSTRVTVKGQVTIPKRIREVLGLRPGDLVEFIIVDGHIHVRLAPKSGIEASYGALGAYAKGMKGRSEKAIMEEVRRKVAYEAAREGLPARRKRSS